MGAVVDEAHKKWGVEHDEGVFYAVTEHDRLGPYPTHEEAHDAAREQAHDQPIPEGYTRVFSADNPYGKLRKLTDDDRRRSENYANYMLKAEKSWDHACKALERATGLVWSVWQTGGGCLALGATVGDDGAYLMLTDNWGPIPTDRTYTDYPEDPDSNELSWMLGVYAGDTDDEDTITVNPCGFIFGANQHPARPSDPTEDPIMATEVAKVLRVARVIGAS